MDKLKKQDYWPTKEWRNSLPEDQGIDSEYLKKMDEHIQKDCQFMRSVLVIRHGYMVYEKHHNHFKEDDLQEVWSITKSVISALVGTLIKTSQIKSDNQKMMDFFEYKDGEYDEKILDISIRNLLNMTSGFEWDQKRYREWLKSDDFIEFILKTKVQYKPDEHFFYDDHNAYMLSAIISKKTGMPAEKYAEETLFKTLGIKDYKWERDSKGINIGGYGLFLTARDMAKIGYLYINNGVWEDKNIIDKEWIDLSTQKQSEGGSPEYDSYGYMWWITEVEGYSAYYACGYGGQYIYVIPELDIVFVSTASPYAPHQTNKSLLKEYIIPAII